VKKKRNKSKKTQAADTPSSASAPAPEGPKKRVSAVSPLAAETEAAATAAAVTGGGKTTKVKAEKPSEKVKVTAKDTVAVGSSSTSSPSSSSSSSSTVIPKKVLKKLLMDLKAVEYASPFLYPVDLEEAPSYLEYVTVPMDISTVEKNLQKGLYEGDDFPQFATDMRLIWANCVAYNDPVSEIARWAEKLGEQFEVLFKAAADAVPSTPAMPTAPPITAPAPPIVQPVAPTPTPATVAAVTATSPTAVTAAAAVPRVEDKVTSIIKDEKPSKKRKSEKGTVPSVGGEEKPGVNAPPKVHRRQDLGVIGKRCWKVCKEMSADPKSLPFLFPIDLSQAPGYLDVIKHPMDLSVIKNQLETYENCPRKFQEDMLLIFDNCLAYNAEGSELWHQANERKAAFEKLYTEHIGSDAQAHMLNKLCPPGDDTGSPGSRKVGRPLGSTGAKKSEIDAIMEKAAIARLPDAISASAPLTITEPSLVTDIRAVAGPLQPAPLVPLSLNVVPLKSSQRVRSVEDVEKLLKLLESPLGFTYQEIREKAAKKARALVTTFETPCWSTAGQHEVLYFGEINPVGLHCSERHLYPKAFSAKRTVKLCLLPDSSACHSHSNNSNSSSSSSSDTSGSSSSSSSGSSSSARDASYYAVSPSFAPFVAVEFTSIISSVAGSDQPVFVITIDG
jgi:Bromodomain